MTARGGTGVLFEDLEAKSGEIESLAEGAVLLHGYALKDVTALMSAIDAVVAAAPWRNMETPGGRRMSVAMTNCGAFGWVSDRRGYRYDEVDPDSSQPWPAMPKAFADLAAHAATAAGYKAFIPDACLINQYEPGTRLTLHQDRNERDFTAPIVSVSLGLPATFLFGGDERADRTKRVRLFHGDVVVWGSKSRLAFHGILPLKEGNHPVTGRRRINLTLRKAR